MKTPKSILRASVIFLTLSTCIFFMLNSCKKKSTESSILRVQLNGYVGNNALSFTDSIYYDGLGHEFYFSTFQMYIAHFSLVKSDNSLVEINPVAFFNYSDPNWLSFTVNAPAGSYKGIAFHVGLDSAQNKTLPQNYPSSNPLGPQTNMFWDSMEHRFVDLEGRYDTAGGSFANGTGLVYHVGTNPCYRDVTINGPAFAVAEGANNQLNLNLDLLKIFYGPTDTLYFAKSPGTQSLSNDLPVAILFANQITNAFSYSQ